MTPTTLCFHLAENKNNQEYPFAFLATLTINNSNVTPVEHVPLGRVLEEYTESNKQDQLLSLLLSIQKASEKSPFLKNLADTGGLFKALPWDAHDAYAFLKDIPLFEEAGVMIRVPNWWNSKQPPRPNIKVSIGNKNANHVGLDALLDFNMHFALPDGQQLSSFEFETLLKNAGQLVQIKGQWVHVDTDKLDHVLSHWKTIERQVKQEGLSFAEGLRLLSGIQSNKLTETLTEEVSKWSSVAEGPWLNEMLKHLRNPNIFGEKKLQIILKKYLKATLRPYQQQGVQWLWWLYSMRLGGCLADDMGLGKTIQIVSLFLMIKHEKKKEKNQIQPPHLLVLPASLLGNWQVELNRFAPDLKIWIAHSSTLTKENKSTESIPDLHVDLVITSYGMLHRLPWIHKVTWDLVVLDEAQAIKNPSAKQTSTIKSIKNNVRFALTGTPIENRLLDLWSLFDFIAPGLLGSSRAFAGYSKQKSFHASVRKLVSPYLLRRLKSDKQIINDLPDKTEIQTYCTLTKEQVALYQQEVHSLEMKLKQPMENMQRRGLVLSSLMRFKQICNHPTQWLGHGPYEGDSSGKFLRLKELCETIVEKKEKVLVFTQFREIIPALYDFLTALFETEGLFLHGQTTIKERAKRVEFFQQEQGPPFFILSLKAGGTGLNLTAASHVIHFDRWWNPAVENQATDRAYRIGQKKNVLVHKFVCRGTIEEKIDDLINSKKSLADEIITGDEAILTELSDTELLKIIKLDIHRALGEE